MAFGNVDLNTPTTQTVLLTSSGTAAVTINAASLTGTGFTMSGVTAPVTLSPGQTETLDLVFDPTAAGAATGLVTITEQRDERSNGDDRSERDRGLVGLV